MRNVNTNYQEINMHLFLGEPPRLQSRPFDFYFEDMKEGKNKTAPFKQIENAGPPLLAFEIEKIIKQLGQNIE